MEPRQPAGSAHRVAEARRIRRAGSKRRTGLWHSALLGLLLAPVGSADPAMAQSSGGSFSIRTHSIDGGGQRSTGGAFAITGVIGQPDAGVHAGGAFVLRGGLLQRRRILPPAIFRDGFEP